MAEGRLKRDQFQNFCASDTILFVHHEEKVLVRIDEILHANSFSEILSDDLPLAKSLGFDTTESAIRRYNDLYDKKNQIAKGVCIFKFSCVVKFLNEIPTPAPARVANPPISTQRELNSSQFSDNNIELDDSDSTSKRFTFCNII